MNITLHAASDAVRELLDQIDPETGELPEGFEQARAIVATKAVATVAYMVEEERRVAMVEEYAKELQQRVKTARARVKWLKGYLATHMAACGVLEIRDERGLFNAKLERERDASVDIFDAAQLPQDYLTETVTYAPNKFLMMKAMKEGFEIPGARIKKNDRLTIG